MAYVVVTLRSIHPPKVDNDAHVQSSCLRFPRYRRLRDIISIRRIALPYRRAERSPQEEYPDDHITYQLELHEQKYSKAIQDRGRLIEELELTNHPPSWNSTSTLLKVFPPAFQCLHEVSQVGPHQICGLGLIAKQPSCIVYSLASARDLRELQDGLSQTLEHCEVFAYDLSRNGFSHIALPGKHQSGTDERMLVVSDVDYERDTEEAYVSPWHRLLRGEHKFIDILRINHPARATLFQFANIVPARTGPLGELPVNPAPRRVGQLIWKLRLDAMRSDGTPMLGFSELRYWWEILEYAGLRPFAAEVGDDGYLEYSWINIRGPRSLMRSLTEL
ncbi:uncharacterized protein B0H18DRAFT_30840 [Fomitopsis serialis]|uniref:uncharacterized protein n=1 Tax=Fomitopsis serialis TaxID=139415 RepID=UPI002008AF20|nr:uncharacterized protein B0H18DRAFT_30840 [Neoantrodia serialis]KAH9932581.1 hypothetical protein B0H18DRAFT_30840 [Neoantrodia serialis]